MWLYLPNSLLSPSVPESEALTWESGSLPNSVAEQLASSVMSRSKPMQPRYWRNEWKKATSPLHRFGPTLKHSQASLSSFVERFTASLPDIPASPFPQQESAKAFLIRDTFSRIFDEQSAQSSLFSASSKMFVDTCRLDSMLFKDAYTAMALQLSQEYSVREALEIPTEESACLSWRTPTVQSENSMRGTGQDPQRRMEQGHTLNLTDQVSTWPTPNVPNGGRKLDPQYVATKGQTPNGKAQVGLEDAAEFWSTPNAHDGRRPGVDERSTQGGNLNRQASAFAPPYSRQDQTTMKRGQKSSSDGQNLLQLWPTPAERDYRSDQSQKTDEELYGTNGKPLARTVQQWPTPRSEDAESCGNHPRFEGDSLTGKTAQWMTPRSNAETGDWQNDPSAPNGKRITLSGQAREGKKRLNPNFVDWLMGFPPGWSSVQIDFAQEAMQLYRSAQLTHLSRLLERLG